MARWSIALTAGLCGGVLGGAPANAEPAEPPTSPAPEEPDPEEGIPRAAATDLRSSHWLLSAGGAVVAPSTGLLPWRDDYGAFSWGGGLRGAVGFGLKRHLVLRLDGGAAWLTGARGCSDCSALTADVGAGLAYVLVQGLAFEPWAAYGVGYRYGASDRLGIRESSSGLDVARLSLGGDFFPLPSFGFGPFLETDVGVRVTPERSGYAAFYAGLRVTFEPQRMGTDLAPTVAQR